MRSKTFRFFILSAAVLSFFICDFVYAEEDYALILRLRGRVVIQKPDEAEWMNAKAGMKLFRDDRIKTGGWGSYAELSFSRETEQIIKVFSNTSIVLKDLRPIVNVNLDKGKVYSLIKSLGDKSSFEIRTPTAICGARGTGWGVDFDSHTTAACHQNFIFVKGLDKNGQAMSGELIVNQNFKTIVKKFQKPQKTLEVTDKERRSWDLWRKGLRKFLTETQKKQPLVQQMDRAAREQGWIESKIGEREDFFEIREMEDIEDRIKEEGRDEGNEEEREEDIEEHYLKR